MATEFPIPTVAGFLSAFQGQALPLARPTQAGTLTSAYPMVLTAPSGSDCTITFLTPAGSQQVTIPAGSRAPAAAAGLSLAYQGGELIEFRVDAASGAMDLSGYVEAAPSAAAVGATLCSVADVKAWAKIEHTDADSILQTIVNAVSEQIERWLGWRILPDTYTERYDGGFPTIQFRHGPVEDLGTVTITEYGTAVDAAQLKLLDGGWTVGRFVNEYPVIFARGRDVIEATYDGGYATVPPDFNLAATMQAGFMFRKSGHGNNVSGIARRAESGGVSTAEYQLDALLPEVQAMLRPYRSRF